MSLLSCRLGSAFAYWENLSNTHVASLFAERLFVFSVVKLLL